MSAPPSAVELSSSREATLDRVGGDTPMTENESHSRRKGFVRPALVVLVAFWITTLCIVIAVVASVLAIWQFTGTDALWRTVATCAVIGAGTLAFSWVNGMFDPGER
jgi:hypothetical protein